MRIIQVVDGLKKGDGVSNVVAALDEFLKKNHYETTICNRRLNYGDIESEEFGSDVIIFYELALSMDPVIKYLKCRKVLIFHNITEPSLLEGADEETRILASAGLHDAARTAHYFDAAITFSEYSKNCLISMGWKAENIFVLPIMVRFNRFLANPSEEIIRKYRGNSVNILFTGRIYPNKKQENIIAAFAAYKERYCKNARLFLVGSIGGGNYYPSLVDYAVQLGVINDVIFTGHVAFAEYLAYYHMADIYLCMSAHEGFCIPLAEAMYFKVPIIAYASTAVPDTLAGSGILLHNREPEVIAKEMNEVMINNVYREEVIKGQTLRLKQLLPEKLEPQYEKVLIDIVGRLSSKDSKILFETRENNKYGFSLSNNLLWQIEHLTGRTGKYVVYGAGVAGARLYMELKRDVSGEGLIICDSYRAGNYDEELGCNIISPENAVTLYNDYVFAISVQDKRAIIDIASYLIERGIKKTQIVIYDMLNHRIL